MAGKWDLVDNSFPSIKQGERASESLQKVLNYMQILSEQFKYQMGNLGRENWNQAELETVKKETTAQVEQDVQNVEGAVTGVEAETAALKENVQTLQGKMNQAESAINYLERDQEDHEQRISRQETAMGEAQADLDTLFDFITVAQDGTVTLGKQGVKLKLVGTVTINGQEVTP